MAGRKRSSRKRSVRSKPSRDFEEYPEPITSLSMFFKALELWLKQKSVYWFRGQLDNTWTLTPSALRYDSENNRHKALDLLADFRRYAEIKLANPPAPGDELKWVQLARHNGLPTRLLDWTGNAAIALYFACESRAQDHDGAVYSLKPEDLNRAADISPPRVLDACNDADIIREYLKLSGKSDPRGLRTIAVNPVWNSERIILQQGAFTLHGSREFTLTFDQAPSIVRFIIPRERKQTLRHELQRAGINEMSIFPELEHMCRYLVWREGLDA